MGFPGDDRAMAVRDCAATHASRQEAPPAFSVIIPVKDRPDQLAAAVGALLNQTVPARELIVVDQSRSDECGRRVEQLFRGRSGAVPELVYVHNPQIDGLTAARNEGLRRSQSPWVLYCDDDSLPEPDGLRLLGQALAARNDLAAVAGIITNYVPPRHWVRWVQSIFYRGPFRDERQPVYWNWSRYAAGQIIPTRRLNGGCMAFRKRILVEIGGFDERYRGSSVGEDAEISQRLLRRAGPASLALVGGAFLRHASLGEWKGADRRIEFEIVAAHYLLSKNRTVSNSILFAWMLCGLLLLAGLSAARRRTLHPLRSMMAGLGCIRNGYQGCPFLKSGARGLA